MGLSIADILTNKTKSQLVIPNVCRGDIFKMRLTPEEGITPKNAGEKDRDKYFIVVGKTESGSLIGFVVINSNVNANISQELQDLHYPITATKYPFLEKNRFVCCTELKEISSGNFVNRYVAGGCFGRLADDDMELVIGALKSSPLVTPKQLKKFYL